MLGTYDIVVKIQMDQKEYKNLNDIIKAIRIIKNIRITMTILVKIAEDTM